MATKDLDFGNVIKQVYDPVTESLKVLATISIGSITVDLDASTDSVRLGDGTLLNTLTNVGGKNAIDVNIAGGSFAIDIDAATGDNIMAVGTTDGTTSGTKKVIKVNTDGTVKTVQLFNSPFDTITCDNPDPSPSVEIYRTRTGGASGTVVQTATITYRDSTKARIENVVVT
jgi:hypothetical protein